MDQAKTRMEFWRARIDIQTKILSGSALETAKVEAADAIEAIRRETDANMAILAVSTGPIYIFGLPRWRIALLLYKPLKFRVRLGYMARALYLYSVFSLFVFACGEIIHLLGAENPTMSRIGYFMFEVFYLPYVGKVDVPYPVAFLITVFNVCAYFWVVRREDRRWTRKKLVVPERM